MIEFFAYLPPIQSALMVSGDGDNLQIKLNIPLKISPDGIRIAGMTGKRLKVTVEEAEEQKRELSPKWSPRTGTENGAVE